MYEHILVPVDDSELAISLAAQAVAFAGKVGARITFLHVRADYAATGEGALMHALEPADFDSKAAGSARAVLARAEAEARLAQVGFDSIVKTSDRPYEVIVDTALEQACDLIFMASHGRKGLRNLLVGSQTSKVLAHTTLPVLVASVEANAPSPEMQAAVAVIKGEHRSLAAVIHALRHAVELARTHGRPLEPALLLGAVHYLKRFSLGLHHPKEEAYLFERLSAHSSAMQDVLGTLHAQHAEEEAFIGGLEQAIEAHVARPDRESLAALSLAIERHAERLWEHMSLEEKFILPACQTHLDDQDWRRIAQAFEANGDPRFDRDKAEGFERLFLRLVSMGSAS